MSLVAKLTGRQQETEQPFAELWVGAHCSKPATANLGDSRVALDILLKKNPEQLLGRRVVDRFGAELPFLLKILSVRTALSIQAHPDKVRAARLHKRDPQNYPDPHHKPEVAVALTDFEFLHGFRPLEEVRHALDHVPELRAVVGEKIAAYAFSTDVQEDDALRKVFSAVMTSDAKLLASQCRGLLQRLKKQALNEPVSRWLLEIAKDYADGDPGIFCFYLMNYEKLSPGEAIYIPANVPHAYLSGDIVECMANSDNVVRAGLTKKFRDVETLIEMLDYSSRLAIRVQHYPSAQSPIQILGVPVEEFSLESWRSSSDVSAERSCDGPTVVLVLAGHVRLLSASGDQQCELRAGEAVFVPDVAHSFVIRSGSCQVVAVTVPNAV